jgi:small-conductance mechanosensitive channel
MTILQPPGTYTVKLLAGGQQLTQSVTVQRDPNAATTDADIQAQTATLADLRKDLETVVDMVNSIETVRKQLADLTGVLQSDANAATVRQAAGELEKRLLAVEDQLIQRKYTGQGQDTTRWPARLVSKMTYLAGGIAGSDHPPTSQAREVHAEFKKQITSLASQLDDTFSRELGALNKLLRDRNIPNVIAR